MKDMTRIIVWTIVGIVVVLGVIFIVVTRRQAAQMRATVPVTDKAYEAFVTRFETRLENLKISAEKAKSKVASPSPEMQSLMSELDAKLVELEQTISDAKGKTDPTEREEAVNKIRESYREARRLIRDLGGTVRVE